MLGFYEDLHCEYEEVMTDICIFNHVIIFKFREVQVLQ